MTKIIDSRIDSIIYIDSARCEAESIEPEGDYGCIHQCSSGEFTIVRIFDEMSDKCDAHYNVYLEDDGCLLIIGKRIKGIENALDYCDLFCSVFDDDTRKDWYSISKFIGGLNKYRELQNKFCKEHII